MVLWQADKDPIRDTQGYKLSLSLHISYSRAYSVLLRREKLPRRLDKLVLGHTGVAVARGVVVQYIHDSRADSGKAVPIGADRHSYLVRPLKSDAADMLAEDIRVFLYHFHTCGSPAVIDANCRSNSDVLTEEHHNCTNTRDSTKFLRYLLCLGL